VPRTSAQTSHSLGGSVRTGGAFIGSAWARGSVRRGSQLKLKRRPSPMGVMGVSLQSEKPRAVALSTALEYALPEDCASILVTARCSACSRAPSAGTPTT